MNLVSIVLSSALTADGRIRINAGRVHIRHSVDGRDQGGCAHHDVAEGAKLAIRHKAELCEEDRQEAERRERARRLIRRGKETLDEVAEDLDMLLSEIQEIASTKPN